MIKSIIIFLFFTTSIFASIKNDIYDMNLTITSENNISYNQQLFNDINRSLTNVAKVTLDIIKAKENINNDEEALKYYNDENIRPIVSEKKYFAFLMAFRSVLPNEDVLYNELLYRSFLKDSSCRNDILSCWSNIIVSLHNNEELPSYLTNKKEVQIFLNNAKNIDFKLPIIVDYLFELKSKNGNIIERYNDYYEFKDKGRINKLALESGVDNNKTRAELISVLAANKSDNENKYLLDTHFSIKATTSPDGQNLLQFSYFNMKLGLDFNIPIVFENNKITIVNIDNNNIINTDYIYTLIVREVYIKSEAI